MTPDRAPSHLGGAAQVRVDLRVVPASVTSANVHLRVDAWTVNRPTLYTHVGIPKCSKMLHGESSRLCNDA